MQSLSLSQIQSIQLLSTPASHLSCAAHHSADAEATEAQFKLLVESMYAE